MDGGGGVGEVSEEENDFFLNIEARNVITEAMASGGVDNDVEASFLADFAEGGFNFGFARFDMAFREASEAIILRDEENGAIMDNDGATSFLKFGARVRVSGVDWLGVGEVGSIGRRLIHKYIIYDCVL